MRKWYLLFILICLFLSPLSAAAQSPLTLASLQVDIRPEFDSPPDGNDRLRVLVMYDLELPQSVVGTQINLRIPASVGNPSALAYGAGDGQLNDLEYSRTVRGSWANIIFTSPTAYVRLEYYDSVSQGEGDTRSFTYTWPGDYAISAMAVQVYQPWSATEMQISPGQWTSQTTTDGLTIYWTEIGQVPAGEEIEIKASYLKSDTDLTVEHLVPQSSGTIPETPSSGIEWQQYIPWILGILGAVMLGGGLFWYWKTGRQGQRATGRPQPPRAMPPAADVPPVTSTDQGGYCHQCGNRTAATDRFCRVCGTRLRN